MFFFQNITFFILTSETKLQNHFLCCFNFVSQEWKLAVNEFLRNKTAKKFTFLHFFSQNRKVQIALIKSYIHIVTCKIRYNNQDCNMSLSEDMAMHKNKHN